MVDLPADLFDAIAESVYGAQGPAPPPPLPPPAPRVFGLQQQCQPAAPPPLRVQYGQAALGHGHGHAVLPPLVHAHQHGHGWAHAHPGFLGYQHGQGAPCRIQGGPGQYCAVEVQPRWRHVVDLYQIQGASPGLSGYYYNRQDEALLYQYASPSFVRLDPGEEEEVIRTQKKKPRLEYDSQSHGGGHSDKSSCVVQASTPQQEQGVADAKVFQESAEHVAKPSPPQPQEIPGTATGPPAESRRDHDRDFIADVDLQEEQLVDHVPDILMRGGDEPPLQLGFDEFPLEDFMKDVPDFWRQPGAPD
ncbi:uncharacterized protein LOC120696862 [Panicum virgatum]|uniref:Uncharacterized protein n=1 Tax=Panicum virgatum TaxID=38727 RepID=A0A8T0UH28_PANVG|nr:uncharacterized protein LOC120696862 [Panicum virgatum]XP_039835811.1 uncharacterized protein LOC120696862 [Panicum virgatum]XP_039835812.1 uncharacterized protein LOC120696862 [Panicum virgatum]XP_039835813.1 uncharacterized protein LOC120696862 [Panicum virgatum]XP_039835814.1 uncharacterized protein LOC120696862 [Panicum virgatum]XP_039835815.1 uncharacterized protein LOC120696862 [Panicum virgatum]XP_039835816.1 uncharacterized protein LOC120696862 [Panicum virgatum]XP_039835817.1 unc